MDLIDDPAPGSNAPEFTVSEIAGTVKKLIEAEFGWVRVRGEVGRVVLARSGHLYFDLKDDRSVLSCMTWKGQIGDLGMRPEEGMEIVAEGRMTASGFQSKFSLNALRVAVAGEGALMALLEKRKKALAAEGLFDEARKTTLPYLPEIIGVVTSPQGAVIRDILHRLRDRFPRKVLVWPVAVQGERCAPDVAAAIRGFNALGPGGALPRPDLLIVARGGGSIEDLWGFNEEIVARAAAASEIPLISAVGHETDTTLIDFVSDRRAPTPTAAAEMAVPVRAELLAWLGSMEARAAGALSRGLGQRRQRIGDLSRALPRPETLFSSPRQRLDLADTRLGRGLDGAVARKRAALAELSGAVRPAMLARRLGGERERLASREARLAPALARTASDRRRGLAALVARLRPDTAGRRIGEADRRLAELAARLERATRAGQSAATDRLAGLARMLDTLGYEATLKRGYAVVWDGDRLVPRAAALGTATALDIQFADGRVSVATAPAAAHRPRPRKPGPGSDQGSLF
ncbi:MAG: exodeoxyribonuclease VII large subunit [Paracoccaceae bacterium]|nr:exodeoxyribonuclease VII large subunit [Paracoccaceae bacterium]